jgi:thaumarchaeosortase
MDRHVSGGRLRRLSDLFLRVLPLISVSIPISILYLLYPASFEQTYHGRTFYLFFVWLIALETILCWEKLDSTKRINKLKSSKTVFSALALALPTIYVIVANYYGLNPFMNGLLANNLSSTDPMMTQHAALAVLSIEYLILALLFPLVILSMFGMRNLREFAVSTCFLGAIGFLFFMDNLYPFGRFAPLQFFVPTTANLASQVLNFLGYGTRIIFANDLTYGSMPVLVVRNFEWASFGIAWPCAGVESLIVYTVTVMLFLRNTGISSKKMLIYFAIGAVVTYFINVVRVVTLFMIAIQKGSSFTILDSDFQRFHNYYGMLYSMTWIIAYPLLILGTRSLWKRIKDARAKSKTKMIDAVPL